MTPVERLEAAIEKLESHAEETWHAVEYAVNCTDIDAINPGGARRILSWIDGDTGRLIVTLHRTINAQLDTLRLARGYFGAAITGPDTANAFADMALALADAILGSDS